MRCGGATVTFRVVQPAHVTMAESVASSRKFHGAAREIRALQKPHCEASGAAIADASRTPVSWSWHFGALPIQAKLAVGNPDDPLEAEADDAADRVMRMSRQPADPLAPVTRLELSNAPEPPIQRACTACGDREKVLRKLDDTASGGSVAPALVHDVLRSPGQPLDPATRTFMEPRFGHDFSRVRIHADARAAASAQAVNARAYTVGYDITFAEGRYAPSSRDGQHLLAHELTHVIQQSGAHASSGVGGIVRRKTEACARPEGVPDDFCQAFPSAAEAEADRSKNRDSLLSSAASIIIDGGDSEVKSLFADFIDGGKPHRDLSTRLATYFTRSGATRAATEFLKDKLDEYFKTNLPDSGTSKTVKLQDAIPAAIAALGKVGDPHVMAFRDYSETPGVLAGGVGVGQVACQVGKIPSGVEDQRTATGTATCTRNSDGSYVVDPDITYTVVDTLDFCPGNPGGYFAKKLTVPLSRYEATDISGDVPFTVKFPAPSLIGAYGSEDA